MTPSALLLLSIVLGVTAGAASPDPTLNLLPWTRPTTWDVALAAPEEPGPRFVMTGRVIGPDSLPAAGVCLYVYHADSKGQYLRPGQTFNRIAGVLRTNQRGEYRIRSIMPGMYEGPGHVHFEVWEHERPVRSNWVSLYAEPGVPPVPGWERTRTATREHNSHMALFSADSAGVYRCRHDLRLDDMAPLPASYDSLRRAERERIEGVRH
jgi:hypothetical protein